MIRIGIGHDTHRLVAGRPLILAGLKIESDRGAEGHSDGDALTHALADAILGALCEGDIGLHFPDSDPQWKDADSLQLLARVVWLARGRGLEIVSLLSEAWGYYPEYGGKVVWALLHGEIADHYRERPICPGRQFVSRPL